jgi:hypothetical protein
MIPYAPVQICCVYKISESKARVRRAVHENVFSFFTVTPIICCHPTETQPVMDLLTITFFEKKNKNDRIHHDFQSET